MRNVSTACIKHHCGCRNGIAPKAWLSRVDWEGHTEQLRISLQWPSEDGHCFLLVAFHLAFAAFLAICDFLSLNSFLALALPPFNLPARPI